MSWSRGVFRPVVGIRVFHRDITVVTSILLLNRSSWLARIGRHGGCGVCIVGKANDTGTGLTWAAIVPRVLRLTGRWEAILGAVRHCLAVSRLAELATILERLLSLGAVKEG